MMYGPRAISCSLLHLVCRVPLLVVPVALGLFLAMPHLSRLPENCAPKAMVTFTFDDGYVSVYEKAMPILEKYGYTGTVFVITSAIGAFGYMSESQLKSLAQKGWEIGSHTVSHRFLTELSDSDLDYELYASKQRLERLGLKVTSFAPPGGRYNEKTILAVSKRYRCQRISWPDGLNDIPLKQDSDRYLLRSVSIGAETTVQEVKQWILRAKDEKKWLILLFHRIDEGGEYSWPSEYLEQVVRFAKEQGFVGVSLDSLK